MAQDVLGYVSLHLHAHLPFVRHPEYEDFLEEDWLYEAISETYLPLLKIFDRATDEGIPFRVSMTMTPPLVAMLRDELLMSATRARLDKLCELADKEVHRTRNDATFHALALHYQRSSASCAQSSTTATSAIWSAPSGGSRTRAGSRSSPAARPTASCRSCRCTRRRCARRSWWRSRHYRRHFGRDPRGIWLPECGYFPGRGRVPRGGGHPLLLRRHARDHRRDAAAALRRLRADLHADRAGGVRPRPRVVEQVWSAETATPAIPTTASSTATSAGTSTTTT